MSLAKTKSNDQKLIKSRVTFPPLLVLRTITFCYIDLEGAATFGLQLFIWKTIQCLVSSNTRLNCFCILTAENLLVPHPDCRRGLKSAWAGDESPGGSRELSVRICNQVLPAGPSEPVHGQSLQFRRAPWQKVTAEREKRSLALMWVRG